MTLILASSSAIRRQMLEHAGVEFEPIPANVDEAAEHARHGDAKELAGALAEAKAVQVSAARPDDWVIGSDSVVAVDGRKFESPADRKQAAEHLRFFSGKAMQLTSAVALARAGAVDWSMVDSAGLQVRPLSDTFIEHYLDAEWPAASYCVGVFRLEGRGVQLFETIEGNFFTILGMPLIPLLSALRERKVIAA